MAFAWVSFEATGQPSAREVRIDAQGNEGLSVAELRATLRTQQLLTYRPGGTERIARAIQERYRQEGYYFCVVDSVVETATEDSSAILAVIHLREGPLLRVGAVVILGADGISAEALARDAELVPGRVFLEQDLQADIARILGVFERSGYPFASVRVDSLRIRSRDAEPRIDIGIGVDEGEFCTISEIIVEGNTETDPDVIVRETRIDEGDVYDATKVGDIRRRIERLNFFTSVSEPELYVRGERCGLLLRVAEGNTNTFDGIIGYQPPLVPEESGYLTGLVRLSFRNIFGTGRRLDARWERATREVTEWDLRYLEPWVLGWPLNLQGGFFQRQQDSAYVRRSFDTRATVLVSSVLGVSASLHATQVIPSQAAVIPGLNRSSTLLGGLELTIDTRDNIFQPRSGIQLRNSYEGGNKTAAAGDGEVTLFVQRLELDASWYQETFARLIAAVSVHGREVRGDILDVSDLYRLGGAASLRGYREEQFSGTRLAWINLEYRYALGRRSFAFAFFDAGYVFQSADETSARPEFTAYRNGYGIGARIETGLGVLGVSYALGQGDGLAEGKIHFGLVNDF